MKIAKIIEELEKLAPPELAEEWDRIGLMTGSAQAECTGVVVSLDMCAEALDSAIESGAKLIVTHHPFIWNSLSRIDLDEPKGALIARLIKEGISVYSMHTNLDKSPRGINTELARLFGGENVELYGLGARFDTGGLTLEELAKRVRSALGDDTVLAVGDPKRTVRKAYVVSGAGGSDLDLAKECADVFITGELKHHQYLEAREAGLCLIQFSHYFSEVIMQNIVSDALSRLPIKVIKAAEGCPFWRV